MTEAHCYVCGEQRQFRHLHDTAHGIPDTHMAGSERFVCEVCGEAVHAADNDGQFRFVLDVEKSKSYKTELRKIGD